MNLDELLSEDESETLDFKAEFHKDNAHLLHDILCLANSYSERDRFLVFGVKNQTKEVVGIEVDSKRKTNADLQNMLLQSQFNRIPTTNLKFHQHISGHEIAVLFIANRPDKPFFVTKDKKTLDGKHTIRAGVIYTRLGDTNTPKNSSASDDKIELMWRERFGIGLSPLSRLVKLLDDTDSWVSVGHKERYLYHKQFPEFTITEGEVIKEDFREPWSLQFADNNATSYYVDLKYLGTTLKKLAFVHCDGGRHRIPMPNRMADGTWSILKNSPEMKIVSLFGTPFGELSDILPQVNVKLIEG